MDSNAKVFAPADAIQKDVETLLFTEGKSYKRLSLEEKLAYYLKIAVDRSSATLGLSFDKLRPFITDLLSFGASIYEAHHTMSPAKHASILGLVDIDLHTVDLGGASIPFALEHARRICAHEERLILLAGSEIPRGGDPGIKYYREVSNTLLDPQKELHTEANLISLYALLADRLMYEEEISINDIEDITQFYRSCAINNPRAATYQKPIKVGELQKYLAYPYATAMIAVATDHAIAFFVANENYLKKIESTLNFSTEKNSLYIHSVGTSLRDKYLTQRDDFTSPAKKASLRAFERGLLKPKDIDYAWVYDCFTLMLVKQVSDYFGTSASFAAKTLAKGYIQIDNKKIFVNEQGGILNNQAAISLSAATGLLDIFSHMKQHPSARNFLFGGNGGVDTVNAVAILSREVFPSNNTVLAPLHKTLKKDFHLSEGHEATVYARTLVRFNPGSEAPFLLGAFRDDKGELFLARVVDKNLQPFLNTEELKHDITRVRISFSKNTPLAQIIW
ncbi:MAG: hypothetical protein LDLANPLL_02170 [Turneriella sp.]|nr:hypothetical protein [Turneriella sp.]